MSLGLLLRYLFEDVDIGLERPHVQVEQVV